MATRPSSSTDRDSPAVPGTAEAPARLGEGCLARYDLQDLAEESGADFGAAAELWRRLQAAAEPAAAPDEGDAATAPQSS